MRRKAVGQFLVETGRKRTVRHGVQLGQSCHSCRRFATNAVPLQLLALAYNLANFLRTLALPEEVKHWSLTTLRDRLVKLGAKIVHHGRSITFQLAEVMISCGLFQRIPRAITALRTPLRC
jgi:hypothetical protein